MTVIVKKSEKVKATVDSLQHDFDFEQFVERFKELYPKEWDKLNREYTKHESKTKPGKSHPMPNPEQYLRNALNVHCKLSGH